MNITGGPLGLPGIPQPVILGYVVSTHIEFLVLVILLSTLTYFISNRIVKSPIGRILKAIREDEIFTHAQGKNVFSYKLMMFMIGAGLASISGVVYATYITYIDPTSFTIMESIFIISIVIIGGAGNLKGSITGAAFLVALPELLRFIGLPNSIAANIRQILYGGLLIVFMLWRPKGFIGEYRFKNNQVSGKT